jgi:hypothetical protein
MPTAGPTRPRSSTSGFPRHPPRERRRLSSDEGRLQSRRHPHVAPCRASPGPDHGVLRLLVSPAWGSPTRGVSAPSRGRRRPLMPRAALLRDDRSILRLARHQGSRPATPARAGGQEVASFPAAGRRRQRRSELADAAARCPCRDARREFPRAWLRAVSPSPLFSWMQQRHGPPIGRRGAPAPRRSRRVRAPSRQVFQTQRERLA